VPAARGSEYRLLRDLAPSWIRAKSGTTLTERGPFYRLAPTAVGWESRSTRAGPFLIILVPLLTLIAPLLWGEPRAQSPATAPSTAANAAKSQQITEAQSSPGIQPIPLPLIADRAEELDYQLRDFSSELTRTKESFDAENNVEDQAEEIRQRVLQSRDLLAGAPTPLELGDEQRYWSSRSQQYTEQRRLLTARAAKLEEQISFLDAQQSEWQATADQINGIPALEAVTRRVQQQMDRIRTTRLQAREQLNVVLILQNRISQQDQQISEILVRLLQFRDLERSRILQQDSRPLWEYRERRELDQIEPATHGSFDRSITSAVEFLRVRKLSTLTFVLIYLVSLFGALKLRRYVTQTGRSEVAPEALPVLKAPFSLALLVALIITGEYLGSAPIGIVFVFFLFYMVPILRFLAPRIESNLRPFLYALAVFYALEGLYLLVQLPQRLQREIYALLVLAAFVSFGWLAGRSSVRALFTQNPKLRILVIGIRTDLLLLAASLVANIVGLSSLAQILGFLALVGPFVAAALYCGVKVCFLLVTAILRMRWTRGVFEIRVGTLETWGRRLLGAVVSLLWLRVMLQLLTVYERVVSELRILLERPLGFDRVHFTLAGTLSIVLILLVGFVFAHAIVFLLGKIVLSRLPLNRGVPFAVSRITYYVLLLLVCLMAMSAAQMELNKFTVLTGALGVGLGFGLQNIVNNFVSGLILLVERPVHIGDTIDVGGLVGAVRRIGARSCTVLTPLGAEVIVPNTNLISNQVVNWTLSSQWRRVDIPVGVAYGTDIVRLIEMLEAVAKSYPGVLLERPPKAFFMGFGENALSFELRFWCARQDTWFDLQSDMTIAVAKALQEAGIEIPFPQRDLHIRSIEAPTAERLADVSARSTSFQNEEERSHS
jgi:potassium-dependent mechanosensitive channel